jgi:DUF1680 family protein
MREVPHIALHGLLGQALIASKSGRLSRFIIGAQSPAIAMFAPEPVSRNLEGDWYGEHAGKWLYAASRAAKRSGDQGLSDNVQAVADYLVSMQSSDGYLGTYAPVRRFTGKSLRGPVTWDGAPEKRTWDIWVHSYMLLGLLEVHKNFARPSYLLAACKIADLCWTILHEGDINITELGNHHGLSATVLLDAAVELFMATSEPRHLALAELILQQADERPELALLRKSLGGADASEISAGKAYQLCWNLVGLAKLHKVTGDPRYLQAVLNMWTSIRLHHLTLGGGPWGGVGLRSREIFNHHSVFSPTGYVETCSILAWIQLNRELHLITGEAKYAEEIECSAYNDLLGAMDPNGEDWCYYSFPNGRRTYTTYWRCCKSSGAMALEELPSAAYVQTDERTLTLNLYGPSTASFWFEDAGKVNFQQHTAYPYDGYVHITVDPARAARFMIWVRIPSWAHGASVQVNSISCLGDVTAGAYFAIDRLWRSGDILALNFPMEPVLHRRSSFSLQESKAPDGAAVTQEVMHLDYCAITRGPLVFSTGLIDGYKSAETVRLAAESASEVLELLASAGVDDPPAIRLHLEGRSALTFEPYFSAGGRADGTWRLTWMQLAPSI